MMMMMGKFMLGECSGGCRGRLLINISDHTCCSAVVLFPRLAARETFKVGKSVNSRVTPHISPAISGSRGPGARDDRKMWHVCQRVVSLEEVHCRV